MNVGQVGNGGGVDRGADRSARVDGKRNDAARRTGDHASISADGRDAAAAFAARVATAARAEEPERAQVAVRAMQRLLSGDLDTDESYRGAAQQLAGSAFRSV